MSLPSKTCSRTIAPAVGLLGLMGALACGCTSAPTFQTASELPSGRRKPDGVAIDPTSAPPAARDRAESRDGLVTLRTPLGVDRAIFTVTELFRVVVNEDSEALDTLFTRDALAVTPASSTAGPGQTPSATLWWKQRFHRLDYTRLAGATLFRETELSIYRATDAVDTPPNPAIRLEALSDNDVILRVPIVTSHLGADRLFGEEIVFWLRREGDRYRIYRVLEDFQIS